MPKKKKAGCCCPQQGDKLCCQNPGCGFTIMVVDECHCDCAEECCKLECCGQPMVTEPKP